MEDNKHMEIPNEGDQGQTEQLEDGKQICRDFARGHCPRGATCPFVHRKGGSNEGDSCRDYSRGHCPRGVRCPYVHEKGGSNDGDICRDFSRGFCPRGLNCPFVHEKIAAAPEVDFCRDFSRGHCPRGARCPFLHDMGTPLRNHGVPPLASRMVPQQEICRDFSRGGCPRGGNCPYVHVIEDPMLYPSVEEKASDVLDVCLDFLRDRCTRGRKCPFLHVYLVDGQENNSRNLRAIHKMKSIKEETFKNILHTEQQNIALMEENATLKKELKQLRDLLKK
eukprot:TRINITY_DN78_c0_g1_i5.p1 TRINITY_DN78_c0_g1~~TRINITY_DN78_c0_g1_i5.p1  ORF type:complete len:298 (+),score=91.71 TRINITY_DN78_c0_g1_i5:58-894(+)